MFPNILLDNLLWSVAEGLAKKSFGWLRKRVNAWENKQLQSRLYIMDKVDAVPDGLHDKPHLLVTLRLWSSIPSRLHPNRVIGNIQTKDFETEFRWEKEAENIYKHGFGDVSQGKNSWMVYVPLSLDTLKKSATSDWFINFNAIFQHELSRAFRNIRFRIKDSHAKQILEAKS